VTIELRHLRYFLAVSEELHFHRAAARVHISQPPLSQAIRQLERELGVQLLRRTSRAVSLTEAGRAFAEDARNVLAHFNVAVAEARRAGSASPALRIGCVPDLPLDQLRRFLVELNAQDSVLQAEVTHLLAPEQVRRLLMGELDLGVFHHAQDHAGIEFEPLFPGEPLAAFLAPGHRLAGKQTLGPDDLRDEVLIASPRAADPALHDHVLAVANERGYQFSTVREASGDHPRDLMLAVASELGIALAPASLHLISGADQIVIRRPLEPPGKMPDVIVAWHAQRPRELWTALVAVGNTARQLRLGEGPDRP
jgi:DNA-binding transcriptional LysR family regulator